MNLYRKPTQRVGAISPLLSVCLILAASINHAPAETPDLYSPVDDVIRLNSTTFEQVVFNQNNVSMMVQFYNTFCGHCQMFAPIYKELATRVKNWTSVIRLAAIDCSKNENIVTCSENKIEGYPTIYIFPPNAKQDEPKDKPLNLRSLPGLSWTVDDIEEIIVDYATNLTITRPEYPPVVDALKPISITDWKQLKRIYPQATEDETSNIQDFMCIVESEQSYLGRKLILEYYRIHSKLELRRILLHNTKLLKSLLTPEDYSKLQDSQPLLIKISNLDSKHLALKGQVLVRGEEKNILPTSPDHERIDFIYDRFKNFFEHYYSIELENDRFNPPRPLEIPSKSIDNNQISQDVDQLDIQNLLVHEPSTKQKVYAIDLLKGITYLITHEIRIKGDLSPSEFNTVRNILTILNKYLPLERWDTSLYKFVINLRTRLDSQRSIFEKDGVKAQEIGDMLDLSGADAVRLRFERENWVSCFKSNRQHKGYTCSLWLLFHTLTVGEYSRAPPARTKPTMVLTTMRDYITKFLGCTVCASNFEKETDQLESSLNHRNSSVLWLWATHNKVNQRLNNERVSENRQPLIDVVFPNNEICPQCIKTDIPEIGLDGKTLDDIEWNKQIVFNFLLESYKPDKVVTPVEMASIMAKMKRKLNYYVDKAPNGFESSAGVLPPNAGAIDMNKSVEQWNLQGLFSDSDMSFCLLLYLACILMVMLVCYSLKPRWKRFKTK